MAPGGNGAGGIVALTGGVLCSSLDPPALAEADVVVADGRVVGVGLAPEGGIRRDCSGCLVVPGNVCAHTHLYSTLARGMPYRLDPPRTFVQILQRVWWRLDRALDERSIRASALVGGIEALMAGTTTLVDHHASPNAIDGSLDVVADALGSVGVRSVLCYEVTDRDGPERAAAGLDENRRNLKDRVRPLSRGMVGAHASFTLSAETLEGCVEVARDAGAGLHVHVAEDDADQADAIARFGCRVIERLAGAGALDERALLAHCVHLDDEEFLLLADRGATAVHNPRSNMNNRVGRAPVGRFTRLALGTDGVDGDLFAEGHAGWWRAREEDPLVEPSWALQRLATSAGVAGRAFGEPQLGRIEPGAPADLVVLSYAPPTPLSPESLAGHWLFGLSSRMVRDVMVDGRWVVLDGEPTGADRAAIAAEGRTEAARLWDRLDAIGPHPFEPAAGPA